MITFFFTDCFLMIFPLSFPSCLQNSAEGGSCTVPTCTGRHCPVAVSSSPRWAPLFRQVPEEALALTGTSSVGGGTKHGKKIPLLNSSGENVISESLIKQTK